MPFTRKRVIGNWGEQQAAAFLVRQGYKILVQNYADRCGEIDIIARDSQQSLCFIEVKTRTWHVGAEWATNYRKQQHMFAIARKYCYEQRIHVDSIQIVFEHISVYLNTQHKQVLFRKYQLPMLT